MLPFNGTRVFACLTYLTVITSLNQTEIKNGLSDIFIVNRQSAHMHHIERINLIDVLKFG